MTKSSIKAVPEYYNNYISLVPDVPVMDALVQSLKSFDQELEKELATIGDKVYAPGKWQINDIIQHLIDAERIFAYRALRFSRNDSTPLAGFDENAYVPAAKAAARPLEKICREFRLLRKSNIFLFGNMQWAELQRTGIANGQEVSVAALGFIIAGHQAHHLAIIKERYLPLVDQ